MRFLDNRGGMSAKITIVSFVILVGIGAVIWFLERDQQPPVSTDTPSAATEQAAQPVTPPSIPTSPGAILDTYEGTISGLVDTVKGAQSASSEELVRLVEQQLLSTRVPAAFRDQHLDALFDVQDIALSAPLDDVRSRILDAIGTLGDDSAQAPAE